MAHFDPRDLSRPDLPPLTLPAPLDQFELPAPIPTSPQPAPAPRLLLPTILGGDVIENAQVRGRGYVRPVVMVSTGDECVTLRIEDDRDPALWLELTLTAEHVGELLARIMAMRPMTSQAALDCLRAMSEHLPR